MVGRRSGRLVDRRLEFQDRTLHGADRNAADDGIIFLGRHVLAQDDREPGVFGEDVVAEAENGAVVPEQLQLVLEAVRDIPAERIWSTRSRWVGKAVRA